MKLISAKDWRLRLHFNGVPKSGEFDYRLMKAKDWRLRLLLLEGEMSKRGFSEHGHLPRLPAEYYRGMAIVHWTMTIKERKKGWLTPAFYYKCREFLAHTMFRYRLCCPVFCCMPDHFHLLLIGLHEDADQRNALKFFRRHLNGELKKSGVELQRQAYDHVLSDDEKQETAFRILVEYIARNPERCQLVEPDQFKDYCYSGSVVPGYPEIDILQPSGWERFEKACSYLKSNGLRD